MSDEPRYYRPGDGIDPLPGSALAQIRETRELVDEANAPAPGTFEPAPPPAPARSLLEKAVDTDYVPTRDDVDQAVAEAEAAWTQHWAIRTPLHGEMMEMIRRTEGITGLAPSSGAEALIDQILAVFAANAGRTAALGATAEQGERAQQVADALKGRLRAPAARPRTYLSGTGVEDVRARLREAPAEEVQGWLDELLDTGARISWSTQLLQWAEEDGNTAPVLQVLRDAMAAAFTVRLQETSAG